MTKSFRNSFHYSFEIQFEVKFGNVWRVEAKEKVPQKTCSQIKIKTLIEFIATQVYTSWITKKGSYRESTTCKIRHLITDTL